MGKDSNILKICMKKLKDYSFLKRFNVDNECREPDKEKKCGKIDEIL